MATIYEGTQREQDLVDERIDPEILRALGLDDVVDLDYSEYKTLLKERLAANRMNTSQKAREDSADLDEKILNEFKRVKSETGRFRVKNDRISFQKMLPGDGGGAIVPNINITPPPEQEQEVQPQPEQGLNDFLTNVVAPSLSRIEASLLGILENMTGQQKAEEKAANQSRIAGQKAQKREKENRFEGLGAMASKAMNVAKKVFSPLSAVFGAIFNFLSNVLTGFLVLKVLDWIQNPQNLFVDIGNLFIMFLNTALKVLHEITFFPLNLLIDGLNNGLNMFESAINNTIGKIPGIPQLEMPEIPKPPAPEIPLIPYPEPKKEEPKKAEKTPKTPAPAMSGGGPVNIFNLMSDGGQVRTDTGEKVTGAGPDTQLVALQPGEFVMSKGAVDTFGVDTMMDMNAAGGGNNTPRMAKVQRVGNVNAMQGGGMVGDNEPPQRASFPTGRQGAKSFEEAMKRYKVQITQVKPQETVSGQPVSEDFYAEGPKGYQSSVHPSASAKGLYKKLGINENVWRTYKDTIASIETSGSVNNAAGSYGVTGGFNNAYHGRYQMGDMAMTDASRILGVNKPSLREFKSNSQLQEDLFLAYTVANHGYLMNGSEKFRNATPIQRMQYLGYAHNQGWGKAADWLETGVISSVDGFGTKGTKFTDKLAKTLAPYSGRDVSGSPVTQQLQQQVQQQQEQQSQQQSKVSAMPGQTDTQYEKTPYQSDLPMVSLKIDDSAGVESLLSSDFRSKPIITGEKRTAPPPPSRSGSGKEPVVIAPPQQAPSSGSSASGSNAPMFSPLDETNPELIVVKAIYNIVG